MLGSNDPDPRYGNGDELHHYEHDGTVWALTFSPIGSLLATANDDCTVLGIDPSTGVPIAEAW